MGPKSPNPLHRRRATSAVLVAVVALLLVAPGAEAKPFTSTSGHYSLTVPDGWFEQPHPDGMEWIYHSNEVRILIGVKNESNARNDPSWILGRLNAFFADIASQSGFSWTTLPHTFTNKAGRIGADCAYEFTADGLRLASGGRVVMFASEHHKVLYMLIENWIKDEAQSYEKNRGSLDTAVDTFRVEGEPQLLVFVLPVVALVAGAYGFRVYRRRKRAKAERNWQERLLRQQGVAPARPGDDGLDPCPDCGQPLAFGTPQCPSCGLEFDWA